MNARNAGRLIGVAGAAAAGVLAGLTIGRARKTAAKAVMRLHGDWVGQLESEHGAIKKMLREMVSADVAEPVKRVALLEKVADALTRHAVEEENVIYPAMRRAGMDGQVDALFEDHARMKTLLDELRELSPEDASWTRRARALKKLVYRHVRKEEGELFPRLKDQMADAGRERLTKLVRREGARVG